MKIYISNSGLTSPVKNSLQDAKRKLSSAKSNTGSAPRGFSHASFVNNLSSKISDYINETDKILNTLESIERKYDLFLSEQKNDFQNINEYKVPERDGIGKKIDQNAEYRITTSSIVGLMAGQAIHKKDE